MVSFGPPKRNGLRQTPIASLPVPPTCDGHAFGESVAYMHVSPHATSAQRLRLIRNNSGSGLFMARHVAQATLRAHGHVHTPARHVAPGARAAYADRSRRGTRAEQCVMNRTRPNSDAAMGSCRWAREAASRDIGWHTPASRRLRGGRCCGFDSRERQRAPALGTGFDSPAVFATDRRLKIIADCRSLPARVGAGERFSLSESTIYLT